ncbi:hypothetical protein V5799_013650 [Amblyomma americanum]|uniref:Uncharacterized protein n=1 Tax=Amblyomma americanum TaxID=6943 RepID=A0AAQ4E597_AMBAM
MLSLQANYRSASAAAIPKRKPARESVAIKGYQGDVAGPKTVPVSEGVQVPVEVQVPEEAVVLKDEQLPGDVEMPTDVEVPADVEAPAEVEESSGIEKPTCVQEPAGLKEREKVKMPENVQAPEDVVAPKTPSLPPEEMGGVWIRYAGLRVNHRPPCTSREGHQCHIVANLTAWNSFFWAVGLELKEDAASQLTLVPVSDGTHMNHPTTIDDRQQAATLLCRLLTTHRCVAEVTINDDILADNE